MQPGLIDWVYLGNEVQNHLLLLRSEGVAGIENEEILDPCDRGTAFHGMSWLDSGANIMLIVY